MKFNKFQLWIISWVYLAQALMGLITFGFYVPSWTLSFALYQARKNYHKKVLTNYEICGTMYK